MCCLLKLHKKWFNGSMAVKKPYITKVKREKKSYAELPTASI